MVSRVPGCVRHYGAPKGAFQMARSSYRLVLDLLVPDAIAADHVVRLLREIPVPGTPIRCLVTPVPTAARAAADAGAVHVAMIVNRATEDAR